MGNIWRCIAVLLVVFVNITNQWKDIYSRYPAEIPSWATGLGSNLPPLWDDFNPGPGCNGPGEPGSGMGAYCYGTPFYDCLGVWQPCGRWRWMTNFDCCYSEGIGKKFTCRMPSRLVGQEKYGENHRTYCLYILDTYDVRSSHGIHGPQPHKPLPVEDIQARQQEEIVDLLSRISDALENQEARKAPII